MYFFFSSRRRHTRLTCDWSSDVCSSDLGASFDISFCTETVIPRRSTPSSSAFIPMIVLMQVPRAVATRSVGENASPLPLLSVGASVAIFDCDGPCVTSQCKSPVYLIEILTMTEYATHFCLCHVERSPDISHC